MLSEYSNIPEALGKAGQGYVTLLYCTFEPESYPLHFRKDAGWDATFAGRQMPKLRV